MRELRWIRERLRREEGGFTLIELLVAAGLCLVGLMAMMSAIEGSRGLVTAAERNEVAAHRAERILEEAIAQPYANLGLQGTTVPTHSTDSNHPNNRVTTGGLYAYRPGKTAPFVLGGTLPHSSAWSDSASRMSGTVYRYVTTYDDPSITGTDNGKRVTVAVTVNGRRTAVTTSTVVRSGS